MFKSNNSQVNKSSSFSGNVSSDKNQGINLIKANNGPFHTNIYQNTYYSNEYNSINNTINNDTIIIENKHNNIDNINRNTNLQGKGINNDNTFIQNIKKKDINESNINNLDNKENNKNVEDKEEKKSQGSQIGVQYVLDFEKFQSMMDQINNYTVSNKELIGNMVKSVDNYSQKIDAYSQKIDVLIHQNEESKQMQEKTLSLLTDLVKKLVEDKNEEEKKKEPTKKEDEAKKTEEKN